MGGWTDFENTSPSYPIGPIGAIRRRRWPIIIISLNYRGPLVRPLRSFAIVLTNVTRPIPTAKPLIIIIHAKCHPIVGSLQKKKLPIVLAVSVQSLMPSCSCRSRLHIYTLQGLASCTMAPPPHQLPEIPNATMGVATPPPTSFLNSVAGSPAQHRAHGSFTRVVDTTITKTPQYVADYQGCV